MPLTYGLLVNYDKPQTRQTPYQYKQIEHKTQTNERAPPNQTN